MKKLIIAFVLGLLGQAQAQTFPVQNLVVNGTFTATGKVGLANLSAQASNTIIANIAASSSSPTAIAVPSCSASSSALQWQTGIGFSCGSFVSTTGSTFTGPTGVAYSNATFTINDTSGTNQANLVFQDAGTTEWSINNTSTGNAFNINRYVSGSYVDSPIDVSNSTGVVSFVDGISNSPISGSTGSFTTLSASSSFTAPGLVTTSDLASMTGNTLLGNALNTTAGPTAVGVPPCGAGGALLWNAGTGFSCATGYYSSTTPPNQPATGFFYTSAGGRMNRFNDRLFLGTATQYDGNQTPSTGDWSRTAFPVTGGQGAYEYLVSNATNAVGAPFGQSGGTFYSRTSDGSGGGTQASIGVSAFTVNDNSTGGGAASWAFYATTVRTATSTGSNTNGMEIDVANLGATVAQYPNAMYSYGLSDGIGVNAGGELQNDPSVTMGTNSAGITISQNDATGHAKWDKGIIFQSTAIAGADGTGGNHTGTAIAMAPGHEIVYYNNSNAVTGGFWSSATTVGGTLSQEQYVQLSNFGTIFTDGNDLTQFRVNNQTTNAANYLEVDAANTGSAPVLSVQGTDTNASMTIQGRGTGGVQIKGQTAGVSVPASYVGEVICAQVTNGGSPTGCATNSNTPVTLSSGVAATITSITLTPGDWDIWGNFVSLAAGTTTTSAVQCAFSTTAATFPSTPNQGGFALIWTSTPAGGANILPCGTMPVHVSSNTTYYLIGQAQFSVSTMSGYGYIGARRRD